MNRIYKNPMSVISALFLLAGCLSSDEKIVHGSEVENEIYGLIYHENGQPAANAQVRVFAMNYLPTIGAPKISAASDSQFQTYTDGKGRFNLDSLPRGFYTVRSTKNGKVSYQDSVYVGDTGRVLVDTLGLPGSLTAFVKLQPNHDPRTATLQVLGTDVFVNANATGAFTLLSLAEGRYRVRVSTTLHNYTTLFTSLNVRAGIVDTMQDSLELAYTGIPVVTGLTTTYSRPEQMVSLKWNQAKYLNFLGYVVYRDTANSATINTTPYNRTRVTDTFFNDFAPPNGSKQNWEYRVVVLSKSGIVGEMYSVSSIQIPAYDSSSESIELSCLDCLDSNQMMTGKLYHVEATWKNLIVIPKVLNWETNISSGILRTKKVYTSTGSDTLVFSLPAGVDSIDMNVAMLDSINFPLKNSIRFLASNKPLIISIHVPNLVFDSSGYPPYIPKGNRFAVIGKVSGGKAPIQTGWNFQSGWPLEFTKIPGDSLDYIASVRDTIYRFYFQAKDNIGRIALDSMIFRTR